MGEPKIAVVTGANRGIGLATARRLAELGVEVWLTSRGSEGQRVAASLAREGLKVAFHPLDVTDAPQGAALARALRDRVGHLDILVNNAGVFHDDRTGPGVLALDPELLDATLAVNLKGPLLVTRALAPLLRRAPAARVVNVSSHLGQMAGQDTRFPAYRLSKVALNALTRQLAAALPPPILVNAVSPGWVASDMGGFDAPRTPDQGAQSVVWAALLGADGPTGGFFYDGEAVDF
ncbi:MAG: SDR family oxidoreductase [Candidatus Competibacterales bacterium]